MKKLDFLLLSTALNLFALSLYRCLDFFLAPAWMFISLLLCGMPLGAVLAQKALPPSAGLSEEDQRRVLGRAALATIGVMAASLVFCLPLLSNVVFEKLISLSQSFQQDSVVLYGGTLLAEGILFLPFFVAFGMGEFVCYQYVLHQRPREIRMLYVLFLAGVVMAYAAARLLSGPLGIGALFVLSIAAMAAFWGRASRRWASLALCAGALLLAMACNIDSLLLAVLLGRSPGPSAVATWGKYCHIVLDPQERETLAFYNGNWAWSYPREASPPKDVTRLDETVFWLTRPESRIAVLGAGGGAQVRQALDYRPREVVAVEMLSDLLDLLRGKWSALVDDVYHRPAVTTVEMEARRYLEENRDPFDVILMASTDSGFTLAKSMFEGQQRLLTREGIQRIRSRLTPDGVFVIRQNGFLRYARSILADAGFHVRAYTHKEEDPEGDSRGQYYWLFGTQKPFAEYPACDRVDREFAALGYRVLIDPPRLEGMPIITDDRPFKGGILVDRIRPYWLVPASFVAMLAICAGLSLVGGRLGSRLTAAAGNANFGNLRFLPLLAFLIGVNFLLVENFLVTALMPHLPIPMDALVVGIIYFIALASIGCSAVHPRRFRLWSVAAVLCVAGAVAWRDAPIGVTLALAAPVGIWTGSLFPSLLSLPVAEQRLVTIYVQDSVGALVGGLLTFGSQFLWGFTAFRLVVGLEVAALAALLLVLPFRWNEAESVRS